MSYKGGWWTNRPPANATHNVAFASADGLTDEGYIVHFSVWGSFFPNLFNPTVYVYLGNTFLTLVCMKQASYKVHPTR